MPGLPFSIANGPSGKQGMLQVLLRDRLSGRHVIFAGTHLKAKAGEVLRSNFHESSTKIPTFCQQ